MFNFFAKKEEEDEFSTDETTFNVNTANGKRVSLVMQRIFLTGEIYPFGARLFVRHDFKIKERKPVECIYSFMLPKDGTIRRFIVKSKGITVESTLQERKVAEKNYEEALANGHLSVLSTQEKDGIINLNIGNLKYKEHVTVILEILSGISSIDNIYRFRFPFALAPSYHAKAEYLATSNGIGEVILPENEFGDLILPEFHEDSSNLHKVGFNLNVYFPDNTVINSPSHMIMTKKAGKHYVVSLSDKKVLANKDLMLNIQADFQKPYFWYGLDTKKQYSFSCIIPASEFYQKEKIPSKALKVVFILDSSGSMQGEPLKEAKKALFSCINKLKDNDMFGVVIFADSINVLTPQLSESNRKNKKMAIKLIKKDRTTGGTEILKALKKGVELLEGEGDIFLITDGQVWGSETIINYDFQNVKIHCLGIGSSSQDRFMSNLTETTGGSYIFLSLKENMEKEALRLFNNISMPVAENIKISLIGDGKIEPAPVKTVYQKNSLKITGYFEKKDKETAIKISWDYENEKVFFAQKYMLKVKGETLRILRGSRLINDLENRLEKKDYKNRIANRLKFLGKEYGISNSQMSLVATIKRDDDVSGNIPKTVVVPVGMPESTSFNSYFSSSQSHRKAVGLFADVEDISPDVFDTPCFLRIKQDNECNYKEKNDDVFINIEKPLFHEFLEKVESYNLIDDDGGVKGDSLEKRIIKTFLLYALSLIENVTLEKNDLKKVKKLNKFLKSKKCFKNFPGLKSINRTIDLMVKLKIIYFDNVNIEKLFDFAEEVFFDDLFEKFSGNEIINRIHNTILKDVMHNS